MKKRIKRIKRIIWRIITHNYWKLHETTHTAYLELFFTKVYWACWSRDCDMCESTSRGFSYGHKAYNKMLDGVEYWAEGPVEYTLLSKAEYEDVETGSRDRIMEAYENGNGSSIYV